MTANGPDCDSLGAASLQESRWLPGGDKREVATAPRGSRAGWGRFSQRGLPAFRAGSPPTFLLLSITGGNAHARGGHLRPQWRAAPPSTHPRLASARDGLLGLRLRRQDDAVGSDPAVVVVVEVMSGGKSGLLQTCIT